MLTYNIANAADDSSEYSIRADPKYADQINAVLSAVAQPTEYKLPEGYDPDAFFDAICGPKTAVRELGNRQEGNFTYVTALPCLESRKNVKIRILPGSKLESVAVRLGLAPASASKMKVISATSGRASNVSKAKEVKANSSVLVPSVPVWTKILAKQDEVPNRNALVEKISAALNCGSEKSDTCLAQRGVLVVRKEVIVPKLPPPTAPNPLGDSPAPTTSAPDSDSFPLRDGIGNHNLHFISNSTPFQKAVGPSVEALKPWHRGAMAQVEVTPATDKPSVLRVADDQWPYDAALVASLINDLRAKAVFLPPQPVGVEDIGLASGRGAPLPLEMFHINGSEMILNPGASNPSPVDDISSPANIGGGTARPSADKSRDPSHDVGLCEKQVDFNSWSESDKRLASHGAIVASLAGGYRLWKSYPETRPALPPISFFRLVGEECESGKASNISVSDVIDGFEFLTLQTDIVSLSFIGETSVPDQFVNQVKAELPYDTKLLFIPAGNNNPGDLDDAAAPCPPCLMQTSNDAALRLRVFVVGAATADLKRADYSGWGSNTVQFYAPGEPVGAVDVTGNPANIDDRATSYATPYAAFAMALLSSMEAGLGKPSSPQRTRSRLWLSTWPLDNDQQSKAGVIDLIKVAAARHHTVEVLEGGETGHPVLRDFVGNIVAGTEGICNRAVDINTQAIRLGPANENNDRKIQYFARDIPNGSYTLPVTRATCRPFGSLTLLQLDGHRRSIDLRSVTQILFSLTRSPLNIEERP